MREVEVGPAGLVFLVAVMAHVVLLYTRIFNYRKEVGRYPACLL